MDDSTDWLATTVPDLQDFEKLLRCDICSELLSHAPTITECSHTFCGECISRHLNTESKCPLCSKQIQRSNLRVSKTIEELVHMWQRKIRPNLLEKLQPQQAVETVKIIPEGYAECPMCNKILLIKDIQGKHIDQCQINQPDSLASKPGIHASNLKRKQSELPKKLSLPVTVDATYVKNLLSKHGLSTRGNKNRLINRYKEWATLYNTNIDSSHPLSTIQLRRKLDQWEKIQDTKRVDIKSIDADSYSKEQVTSFDDLIAQARKKVKSSQPSTDSPSSGGSTESSEPVEPGEPGGVIIEPPTTQVKGTDADPNPEEPINFIEDSDEDR